MRYGVHMTGAIIRGKWMKPGSREKNQGRERAIGTGSWIQKTTDATLASEEPEEKDHIEKR